MGPGQHTKGRGPKWDRWEIYWPKEKKGRKSKWKEKNVDGEKKKKKGRFEGQKVEP